jgi:hypothetical protein
MKRKSGIIILYVVMAIGLVACNSMESDAKKMAKLAYKTQVNIQNNAGNEADSREAIAFGNKMSEKYGENCETKEQFGKLVEKEMEKLRRKK